MKKIIIKLIKLYQEYLSLDQGFLRNLVLGKNSQIVICRYQPTCSDYTYQAVEKYGVIKGLFLELYLYVRGTASIKCSSSAITKL